MAGSTSRKTRSRVFTKRSEKLATVNTVKSIIGNIVEHKFFSAGYAGTADISGVILPLTQKIAEGDTNYMRSGTQIKMVSANLKYIFKNSTSLAAGYSTGVRLVLFKDMRAFGSDPTVTNVLRSSSIVSNYDLPVIQGKAFKILYDKSFTLSSSSSTNMLVGDVFRPMKHTVTFYGAGDTSANSGPGAVYALIVTDTGTNPPAWYLDFCLRYTDA